MSQGSPVTLRGGISCTCGLQQLCVATPSHWGRTASKPWSVMAALLACFDETFSRTAAGPEVHDGKPSV